MLSCIYFKKKAFCFEDGTGYCLLFTFSLYRGFYMSTTDAAVYPQHCLDGSNGAHQEEPEDPVTDSISFR